MFYEAVRLNVESVMNLRIGRLQARYLASDGTREWDQLWRGEIPVADTEDPLDDICYLLSVILKDLEREEGALQEGAVPQGGYRHGKPYAGQRRLE